MAHSSFPLVHQHLLVPETKETNKASYDPSNSYLHFLTYHLVCKVYCHL